MKHVENEETGESITIRWQAQAGGAVNETTLNKITKEKPTVTNGVMTFTANIASLGAVGDYIRIYSIQSRNTTALRDIPLENLDTIRDNLLMTPGDIVYNIADERKSLEPFTDQPTVYLGGNHVYAAGSTLLYTEVDVASTVYMTDASLFAADPTGFFVFGNCLYRARGTTGTTYSIFNQMHPRSRRTAVAPESVSISGIDRLSGVDVESEALFMATVGGGSTNDVYLTLFSNVSS